MSSDPGPGTEPTPATEPEPATEPAPQVEPAPAVEPGGSGDGEDPADLVAAAVLAVPGVRALHGGALGEVGTYLPGRRVAGVRLGGERCAVHVVLEWDAGLSATSDLVRDAVRTVVPGVAVDVTVEDVAAPTGRGRR